VEILSDSDDEVEEVAERVLRQTNPAVYSEAAAEASLSRGGQARVGNKFPRGGAGGAKRGRSEVEAEV